MFKLIGPVLAEELIKASLNEITNMRNYPIDSKKENQVIELVGTKGMTLRQALKEVGYFE